MRLEALRRSTAARTAAAYLLLFIFAISLSYATSYFLAGRDASERLRVSIMEKKSRSKRSCASPTPRCRRRPPPPGRRTYG